MPIDVKDASGATISIPTLADLIPLLPTSVGSKADAASLATTQSTEDKALLADISARLPTGTRPDASSLATTQSTEDKAALALVATETTLAAQSAKLPATLGSKADAASFAVTQSTEDKAALAALSAKLPASLGSQAAAASLSTTPSVESIAIQNAIKSAVQAIQTNTGGAIIPSHYEPISASVTDQILGATGAVGDYFSHLLIIPATTAAGAVSITDGNGSAINVFVTGTLPSLTPFSVTLGAFCLNATTPGWKVTTGANVSAIAFGNFT